jgi:PKD repeat protein
MKILNRMVILIIIFSLLIMSILPANVMSKQKNKDESFIFVEPGPTQESILYIDGSKVQINTESVTHLMVGSKSSDMTKAEFKKMILSAREKFDNDDDKVYIGVGASNPINSGLDIVFVVSNPPAGAVAALEAVAQYIESIFADSIYVEINVQFAKMFPRTLGGTSCNYAESSWSNTQTGLVNDMDNDDTIQNYIPDGSTIPVRYDGASPTETNEDRCFLTKANYNAAIGTVSGAAADMTFNNRISWDWDPSDGITSRYYCFQSVLAHEIGHVLGFTSGADFRTYDMETLDIYRFQKSDGTGDYNPDTLEEFETTARLVDKGVPDNDHNSDIISVEYEMADGSPDQASHFRQGYVNAIMQPAFSSGVTFYPDFYKTPDVTMFDAIGWDYPISTNQPPTCTLTGNPTSGDAPLEVVFSMTANDPDGSVDSWELDIDNDGTAEYSGTGDPPSTQSHTYNDPGYYTAELTVWDNEGATGTDTESIHAIGPNQAPNAPTNPDPTNGEINVDINPTLSVLVSDPDLDNMDVTFYDYDTGLTIGTDYNVASGDRASILWSGLDYLTTYNWYAEATDGEFTTGSDTWSFTTEDETPEYSMYVWDISWYWTKQGRFKTLYMTITVQWDSNDNGYGDENDAVVENADVTGTLSLDGVPTWNFEGTTGSDGTVTFYLSRAPLGTYTALVTDITHATYIYDSDMDVDNPDSYTLS